ncbi:MAG: hypothetical protein B7Y47_09285 [Sphingomonas sp. 28-63-12]|nr:MAG: hypothetical protein B7Y47_09285 [Sphingomonas sp. 28-63-12]
MALVFFAAASSAFANTPPIPPPDPDRLAVAQRLVDALPLEAAVGDGFGSNGIAAEVADNAVAWFAIQSPEDRDENLKSVFYEKVKIESRTRVTAAIGDARASLSSLYARQLSERELMGAETFALTPEGKAFLLVQLSQDVGLRHLVSIFLYQRTFPELPRLLQSSRESSAILKKINRAQ